MARSKQAQEVGIAARFLMALVAVAALISARPIAYEMPPPEDHAEKRIAITFDDAPRGPGAFLTPQQRTALLIRTLAEAHVSQAAFFVNPARADAEHAALIDAYVDAGHVIANHTDHHMHLSGTSAERFLADIDAAEAWLKPRKGYRPWFRYPYLDEGGRNTAKRDAVRAGLAARGLRNGYVTIDGSDWNMEALAIAAKRRGKPIDMAALRKLYVDTHVQSADFNDALARRTLGRSPMHVLLLHETDVSTLFIGDLVRALRADGWEIVPADTAFADPIYGEKPDVALASGTIIEMLAWEKGVKGSRWYARNDIKYATKLFDEQVLHEGAPAAPAVAAAMP